MGGRKGGITVGTKSRNWFIYKYLCPVTVGIWLFSKNVSFFQNLICPHRVFRTKKRGSPVEQLVPGC